MATTARVSYKEPERIHISMLSDFSNAVLYEFGRVDMIVTYLLVSVSIEIKLSSNVHKYNLVLWYVKFRG